MDDGLGCVGKNGSGVRQEIHCGLTDQHCQPNNQGKTHGEMRIAQILLVPSKRRLIPRGLYDLFRHDRHTSARSYSQSQRRRRLFSEARATPPLMSGTITNSRTLTPDSSTRYSSTSRIELGGLKFHCWRTISRNERPPSGDHRKVNSWVRSISFSSKTSAMRLSACDLSKTSRMV